MVIRRATELLGRGQGRLSWPARAGTVAAGLALAQVLPEPPNRYHPVAWFGSTMERAEQRRYRDDRARGVQHTAIGAAIGAATGFAGRLLVGPTAMNVVATTVTVGGRMLTSEAVAIGAALDAGDLDDGPSAACPRSSAGTRRRSARTRWRGRSWSRWPRTAWTPSSPPCCGGPWPVASAR